MVEQKTQKGIYADIKKKALNSWDFTKTFISTALQGKLLLSYPVSKYFIHIIFVLSLLLLWTIFSLHIENTFAKEQRNKKILNDMEIAHSQKTVQLMQFNKLTKVLEDLKQENSKIGIPEKPATIINK